MLFHKSNLHFDCYQHFYSSMGAKNLPLQRKFEGQAKPRVKICRLTPPYGQKRAKPKSFKSECNMFCYNASLAKIIVGTVSPDHQIPAPFREKESFTQQEATHKIRDADRRLKGFALD